MVGIYGTQNLLFSFRVYEFVLIRAIFPFYRLNSGACWSTESSIPRVILASIFNVLECARMDLSLVTASFNYCNALHVKLCLRNAQEHQPIQNTVVVLLLGTYYNEHSTPVLQVGFQLLVRQYW